MQILNTSPGASIILLNDAEQATWESENPAVGDFLINTESLKLVYLDDAGAVVEVAFLGDVYEPQTAYIGPYTGATYVNAALIDAVPQMLFMDGFPRTLVASAPDPGFEWSLTRLRVRLT